MESTLDPTRELPALYRTVLALAVELERWNGAAEAGRIRTKAQAAYGGPWDEGHQRRLRALEVQLLRSIEQRAGTGRYRDKRRPGSV